MGLLTAEVISRSVFGQRLGRRYTDQIVRSFAEYQKHVGQTAIADMIRLPAWIPRRQGSKVKRAAERIHKVIDQIIDDHLDERRAEAAAAEAVGAGDGPSPATASGCPHKRALIAQLFDAGESGSTSIDRAGIRNEAIVLFMAGHETTANTLAWAFYLLSQAEWARERLAEEHDRVLGGREPTFEDVDRLLYTKAVIEETLRLYPPVPILGREAMSPTKVDGAEVDEGAIALVAPWLLHRNPSLWERPDDFIPERFLPEATRPSKYQYVPFAIGPRVCPGLAFGLTEAVVCLAVLCQVFELRLKPGTDVQPKTRLTLRPGDELPMTITPRRVPSPAVAAE
jgi:cytochrome P450